MSLNCRRQRGWRFMSCADADGGLGCFIPISHFFWRVEHLVNKRFLIVLIFFTLPPAASASAPAPAPNVTFAAAVHIELEPTGEEIKAEAEAEAEAQKSANSAAQNFNYHE